MKKENQYINDDEKLVKDLFEDFSLLTPSTDFKKATMNKVMIEWSSKPIYTSAKMSKQSRIWIGVGVIIASILIYLFDIKDIVNGSSVIKSIQLTKTQNAFSEIFKSSYMAITQIPLLIYVITIGIGIVIAIDKLINKLTAKSF